MPRAPNEETRRLQEEAKKLFLGGMKLIDISKKLDKPDGTIRRWKSECNWDNKSAGNNKKKESERSVKGKANVRKGKGGQPGNKNAKGHGAPKGSRNAETHGFFTKHLPKETMDIISEIEKKDPTDILFENIQICYAAILRAQKIMYVENKDEMIKEIKKVKTKSNETNAGSSSEKEVEWEFQFAWDRQASFLTAQSRAMAELRSLIRQYEDNATEEQMERIAKIKAETTRIKKESEGKTNDTVEEWVTTFMEESKKDDKGNKGR